MSHKEKIQCAAVLGALFFVQLVMHLNADTLILDDQFFYCVLDEGGPILGWLSERWQTWSSRQVIEGILALTTHSIWTWRVLDSLMMVCLSWGLARLAGCERRPFMLAFSGLMVTAIPFAILRSTGWQATSINYYWPLACTALACVPLADALWGRKQGKAAWAALLPALLACGQEQTAALMLGSFTVLGTALLIREKRVRPVLVALFAFSAAAILAHLSCPGNAIRSELSVSMVNLRDYEQFSIIDRLSIGLTSTTALLLFTWNPIFVLTGICVVCAVMQNRRSAGLVLLSAVPLAFGLLASCLPKLLPEAALVQAYGHFRTYTLLMGPELIVGHGHPAIMTAVVFVLALMALALYLAVGHRPLSACAVFVFALGFAARMALSFSPTVVESGERTMLPLYGAMMLCALLCLAHASGKKRWPVGAAFALAALFAAQNFLMSFTLAA